jgi:hypothetical protein
MKMAANAAVPTRPQIVPHLREHHWAKADAKAFVTRHAAKVDVASYDDWEDLSREFVEAEA